MGLWLTIKQKGQQIMRLSNGDVLLHWPLAQHIITAGWLYNDGSLLL